MKENEEKKQKLYAEALEKHVAERERRESSIQWLAYG